MKLNFFVKNHKISDGSKIDIENEIKKLKKYHDGILDAEIHVTEEKQNFAVQITVHVKPKILVAQNSGTNLYKTVSDCVVKLERQLKKAKQKHDPTKSVNVFSTVKETLDDEDNN